ncbi:MAG: hypothetical protein EHM81_02385 [Chloroflexi bacterium]|nr:MAG: hypothetical protein EHM81_02385 [Chloroflexota bacterium]
MKKTWKWILGILIVLVVATLMATPFVLRSALGAGFSANLPARAWMRNPGADNLPRDFDGGPGLMPRNWQRNNPRSFGGDFGHMSPRMGGGFSRFGGFTPFGMGFFFLGGLLRLIPLALLGLLGYGLYQMGKRAGARSIPAPAPVSTVAPPPEAPAE